MNRIHVALFRGVWLKASTVRGSDEFVRFSVI